MNQSLPPEIHPRVQQRIQDRLERAYRFAGRDRAEHPNHSLYTGVIAECAERGIAID